MLPDPAMLINEDTEEGAKSAAKYFVELQNYIVAARDVTAWDGRAAEGCVFCVRTDDLVEQLEDEDLIREGGGSEVTSVDETIPDEGTWMVFLTLLESAYVIKNQSGEITNEGEKVTTDLVFNVKFDSQWLLVDVG